MAVPPSLGDGQPLGPEKGSSARSTIFYGWVIVATCVVCKIARVQGQNNVMSYTVPHLLEDIQLSNAELGTLFSIATVSASCVQPYFGRAVDKLGARLCMPVAMACLALSLAAFSAAQRFASASEVYAETVVLFFFLRSLSMGAMETFPSACVQKWFVRRRGRALALVATLHQLGNAVVGVGASALVQAQGWRATARCGAYVNLALAVPTFLLLRSSPEDCGDVPDGVGARDAVAVVSPKAAASADPTPSSGPARAGSASPKVAVEVTAASQEDQNLLNADGTERSVPKGLGLLYALSFFSAVIFGGCDFEMVGMVMEAGGGKGGVDVAAHVFMPMALASAFGSLLLGEVMDKASHKERLALWLLCLCSAVAFVSTNLLCYLTTPARAVTYALLRGVNSAVYNTLLMSGLAYSALGVHRDTIGSVLGVNTFACVAGTGFGPLLYGVGRDVTGTFRLALEGSSVASLVLAICFAVRAMPAAGPAPAKKLKGDSTPHGRRAVTPHSSLGRPVDFGEVTRLSRSEAAADADG